MDQYENAVKLWQSHGVASEADLDKYLDSFRILFAYHSGKIENEAITYNDTREIFEDGRVTGYTGDPRTLFEQQNQKLCYEALKPKIVAKEPVSLELVKEIHRILTSGCYDERRYIVNGERPGEFKKHDYVTGINEVGSAAEDVEVDLKDLLDELRELGAANPLKAAAYLHARFEYIHPFADGNGRVGRTLLNYWLMISGHPPLIIYEDDRHRYYDALRQYDENEVLEPLAEFMKKETARTWAKAMELDAGGRKNRQGLSQHL